MMINMKYCEKCKVSVPNPKQRCPLCQGMLTGGDGTETETFPNIPTIYRQYSLYFRLMILGSVAAGVISVMINMLLPDSGWWSLFVVGGLVCMWIPLWTAVRKRSNISKNILYQVVVLSLLLCGWDGFTGWHRWSVNFAIPALCISAMLGITIVSKVMHLKAEDYIIYLLINIIFGLVPFIFAVTGLASIKWLCLASMVVSVVGLTSVFHFTEANVWQELKKRFHL